MGPAAGRGLISRPQIEAPKTRNSSPAGWSFRVEDIGPPTAALVVANAASGRPTIGLPEGI